MSGDKVDLRKKVNVIIEMAIMRELLTVATMGKDDKNHVIAMHEANVREATDAVCREFYKQVATSD